MKERMDSVLKYSIYVYGFICSVGYITDSLKIINSLTFKTSSAYDPVLGYGGGYSNVGYEALYILAVLIVIRFIVFGKTYQK
jgi:hypothetical protein